jgi:hypothetical protein
MNVSTRRWLFRSLLLLGVGAVALFALALILIAIPLTRRVIIVGLAEWMLGGRLESLAVDLDIQPNLRWIFTLLVILPVGFGLARMVIARRFGSALRGLALAAGTLFVVGLFTWWHTRHFNFDAKGRPVVYLSFRRDGAHKSYSPGVDRVTGRPKFEATLDRVLWLSYLARQPVCELDPARETAWFDGNSGEPNLWYVQTCSNRWQFFNRPHFHQQLRVEVSPITPGVMACWKAEQDRQAHAAECLRRQREAEAKAAAEKQRREEDSRRTAAEAERKQRSQQAAETLKRQTILNRRAREATAQVQELEWLHPASLLTNICPGLNVESFRPNVFDDDVACRRFRFKARVLSVQRDKRIASFEPVTISGIHFVLEATFQPEATGSLRAHREAAIVGTVVGLHFSNGLTNINGIPGQVCLLELGNSTLIYALDVHKPDPAARQTSKTQPSSPPPAQNSTVIVQETSIVSASISAEPEFVAAPNPGDASPVQPSAGLRLQAGIRLLLTPANLFRTHVLSAPRPSGPPVQAIAYRQQMPGFPATASPTPLYSFGRRAGPPSQSLPHAAGCGSYTYPGGQMTCYSPRQSFGASYGSHHR